MKKPTHRKLSIFAATAILLPLLASAVDCALVARGTGPLCTIYTERLKDGGTELHCGVLHDVIVWHQLRPPQNDNDSPVYTVGTEFRFCSFLLFGGALGSPDTQVTRSTPGSGQPRIRE